MQALMWHGDRVLLEELAAPEATEDEVVVAVRMAGVCGSDLHALRGRGGSRQPPLILGHEAVVEDEAGARYALFPLKGCGACEFCRDDRENLCPDRKLLGLHRPGTFSTHVAVPRSALVPISDDFDDLHAVLVEPLATSLSAVRAASVSEDTAVLVIGCGAIGLMAVFGATQTGAHVIAADPSERRRAVAAELGAETVSASEDVRSQSAELVIDAVGIGVTVADAIRVAKPGGTVALLGLGEDECLLPIGELVRRGVGVTGHYAYSRADFDAALGLLESAAPGLGWLTVTPLAESTGLVSDLLESPDLAVKGIIQMK